jgi:hypothetical protein
MLRGKAFFSRAVTICKGDFADTKKAARFTVGNHGENDLPTNTSVDVSVTGLDVTNAGPNSSRNVTLKKVAFVISGKHPRQGARQPEFDLENVEIDGLAIDGAKVRIHLAKSIFRKFKTQDALKTAYEGDREFFEANGHLFYPVREFPERTFPQTSFGYTRASVVDRIEWENPKKTAPGVEFLKPNQIRIEGFGTIYLGEITISPDSRRVALLRAELGSPDGGGLEMGSGDINGYEVP